MIYYQLNQIPNAYKATEKALELSPNDPHVLYHHARYSAKMGYKFTNFLKKSAYKDPHYLVTANIDETFSEAREQIQKLAEELRDEKKKEVDNLLQKINLVKKEAETIKIGDWEFLNEQLAKIEVLYSFDRHLNFQKDFLEPKKTAQDFYKKRILEFISSLNEKLAEIKRVYSRNSYFDFLEAKNMGQNIYFDFQKSFLRVKEIAQEAYVKSLLKLITTNEPYFRKLREEYDDSFNFKTNVSGLLISVLFPPILIFALARAFKRKIRRNRIANEVKIFEKLLNIKGILEKIKL